MSRTRSDAPTGHKLFNFTSTSLQSRRWAHIKRSAKKPSAPDQMPETVTTEILEDDLITLIEGSPEERDKCIQSIFERLEEDDVGSLLSGFCIGDRETYNDDPIIMGVSFDDEISGTIDVAFTGSAYFGCKDMDRLDEHDETVTFTIDREASTVDFSTNPPDLPERPMDDI